ncbi:DUF6491 family protein [uncultured Brevundimonas sp.]|uniref:DUF6491 family protein n=1 Tax=uncultured Brevundimonas sp. TaxID=213418 RepID=UPI0030ECC69E|tara:strand:- start:46634 stop:47056 length:423 start_codon:yes stop_codon:yes gene_type:complete
MPTVSIPMARTLALAFALTSLATCAPGQQSTDPSGAASQRQCFWASSLSNFRQGDHGSLYVRDRSDQVFEVSTRERCQELDLASSVAIQSEYSSVGRLCVGDNARITMRGLGGEPASCRARVDRRLTADEIAALPDNQRP